mmetsp:Transcript_19669/g.52493  ORF Transcript_19669/g.52493 Transcript_19669/m.52493 type:complete len:112 (+) Transcript_19669:1932-2267(+)
MSTQDHSDCTHAARERCCVVVQPTSEHRWSLTFAHCWHSEYHGDPFVEASLPRGVAAKTAAGHKQVPEDRRVMLTLPASEVESADLSATLRRVKICFRPSSHGSVLMLTGA